MEQKFKILGAKSFNDTVEGVKYNTTKLFIELKEKRVISDARNVVGFNVVTIEFGDSTEFTKHKMADLPWPINANLDVEMTTKGMICNSFEYIKPSAGQQASQANATK